MKYHIYIRGETRPLCGRGNWKELGVRLDAECIRDTEKVKNQLTHWGRYPERERQLCDRCWKIAGRMK